MSEFGLDDPILRALYSALMLTGILVYFGIHVIGRQVIFVDLALAQIAALGTAFGVLMGYEAQQDTVPLFAYSFSFTVLAAMVFSITKMRTEDVPHEAIIGIAYAVAVAATMIVLTSSPLGPQEFERMMKGDITWVTKDRVKTTALIFAAVGVFHWLFRRQFFSLSFEKGASLSRAKLWDFFFYVTFGFVVTSSVALVGVFLVFSYLIIPAVGALLFTKRLVARLAVGWVSGSAISLLGVLVSYHKGYPTSPLIVVFFAIALILAAVVRYALRHPDRGRALINVGVFATVFALFGAGLYFGRKRDEDPFKHTLHLASSEVETQRIQALEAWKEMRDHVNDWLPRALELLKDKSKEVRLKAIELLETHPTDTVLDRIADLLADAESDVREAAMKVLKHINAPRAQEALLVAMAAEKDPELRVEMLEGALEGGSRRAVDELVKMIEDSKVKEFWRREAYEHLKSHVAFEFTQETLSKFKDWWTPRKDKLAWDPQRKVFHE